MKYVFIVNGYPHSGKTTFGTILGDYVSCQHISIIDPIKEIAKQVGWDEKSKFERDRNFLSDLKDLIEEYSNYPFQQVIHHANEFWNDDKLEVLLIDMRDPYDIERAVRILSAKTIFIKSWRGYKASNHADTCVEQYDYDFVIENNGTLEEFREKIHEFAEQLKG